MNHICVPTGSPLCPACKDENFLRMVLADEQVFTMHEAASNLGDN